MSSDSSCQTMIDVVSYENNPEIIITKNNEDYVYIDTEIDSDYMNPQPYYYHKYILKDEVVRRINHSSHTLVRNEDGKTN